MVVENATIIIGISSLLIYFILYRVFPLAGSLSMMGLGVLTYYYSNSSLSTDVTAYGIFGTIIFAIGLALLIHYLFLPLKKRK